MFGFKYGGFEIEKAPSTLGGVFSAEASQELSTTLGDIDGDLRLFESLPSFAHLLMTFSIRDTHVYVNGCCW
jgi:hypothetical protein